jgi:UDPglucose 6-dehydrogenase
VRITVIGTGYVGLVVGACLAETGNDVTCADVDADKIADLSRPDRPVLPIYEPGLEELVERNRSQGRLSFTTAVGDAVGHAEVVFIAVGTPPGRTARPTCATCSPWPRRSAGRCGARPSSSRRAPCRWAPRRRCAT